MMSKILRIPILYQETHSDYQKDRHHELHQMILKEKLNGTRAPTKVPAGSNRSIRSINTTLELFWN